MAKTKRWFKYFDGNNTGGYSGKALPRGEGAVWGPVEGPLELCTNGIHVCKEKDLLKWIIDCEGASVVECFPVGEMLHGDDKSCCREVVEGKTLAWG